MHAPSSHFQNTSEPPLQILPFTLPLLLVRIQGAPQHVKGAFRGPYSKDDGIPGV